MCAATAKSFYDIWKEQPSLLNTSGIEMILIGSLIAFIVAKLLMNVFIESTTSILLFLVGLSSPKVLMS
jgi:undecaprenyl-diphosphatase